MLKQLPWTAISAAGIAVALTIASIVIAGAYIVFTGSGYSSLPVTTSNALFFAGGFLILIGAGMEFFHVKGWNLIGRFLNKPELEKVVIEAISGWTVIYSGGLMIAMSLAIVLIVVK